MANGSNRNQRLKRLVLYAGWTFGSMLFAVGVDRLVICPFLKDQMGRDPFGTLMWVRDLATLFANTVANGFGLYFIRNLVHLPIEQTRQLMRTTGSLVFLLSVIGFPVVAIIVLRWAPADVRTHPYALLIPFGILGLARSLELVISASLRFRRQFQKIFAIRCVEGGVLIGAAFLLPRYSFWVVGIMYVASAWLPLLLAAYFTSDIIRRGTLLTWPSMRQLTRVAPMGSLLTGIENAQMLFPRLFVGMLAVGSLHESGGSQVTLLFVATSIGYLFAVPFAPIRQLILSLLAGRSRYQLSTRESHLLLAAVAASSVVVAIAAYAFGRWLVHLRYPDEYDEVLRFYHWICIGVGCMVVRSLLKPFAVRFLAMPKIIAVSSISLTIQVIALVVLVPRYQAAGAAMAFALSMISAAFFWTVAFQFLRQGVSADRDADPATADEL